MSRLRRDTRTDRRRAVRQVTAAVAVSVLGRVLIGAAVDAFILYVFGDPAAERDYHPPAERASRRSEAGLEHRPAA